MAEQKSAHAYLAEHVGPLLRPLLAKVALDRPTDIAAFLLNELQKNSPDKELPKGTFSKLKAISDELMFMGTRFAGNVEDVVKSMVDLSSKPRLSVDGKVFSTLVATGYAELARNKDELNKINVFPIPDADTGNNMKVAMRTPALALLFEPIVDLQKAANECSSATLLSGQGNSGTVLSHFFVQLAALLKNFGGAANISVSDFGSILEKVGQNIHSAFPADKVQEGTIVSVIRKGTDGLGSETDVKALVVKWEAQSKVALYQTPDELEVDGKFVLKDAGVDCDSGAKGFYYMVKGMLDCCNGKINFDGVLGRDMLAKSPDLDTPVSHENAEKFRYCTECVIVLKDGATKDDVEKALDDDSLGDSKVLVAGPYAGGGSGGGGSDGDGGGGATMMKVHIHTDQPDAVFEKCQCFNALKFPLKEKTEDMQRQIKNAARSINPEDFNVTFIGDSTTLTEPWAETGMAHVPIICMIKGEPYPCNFEPPGLSVTDFLNKSRHDDMDVGTAAPSAELFRRVYEEAVEIGKPVFCNVVSGLLSKLASNAKEAVGLLPADKQDMIKIFDHGYMTSNGAVIQAALYEKAATGAGIDEIAEYAEYVQNRTFAQCFMNATGVQRLAHHGRVPKALGDKVAGLDDSVFSWPLGLIGGRDKAPTDPAGRAGSLKIPALAASRPPMGMVTGPGATLTAVRETLEVLRDSLKDKPKARIRNVHVGNVSSRVDVNNKISDLIMEIVGDRVVGEIEQIQPMLALAIIAAWGGVVVTYWVDDGE